jgi:hypothetical protein
MSNTITFWNPQEENFCSFLSSEPFEEAVVGYCIIVLGFNEKAAREVAELASAQND